LSWNQEIVGDIDDDESLFLAKTSSHYQYRFRFGGLRDNIVWCLPRCINLLYEWWEQHE